MSFAAAGAEMMEKLCTADDATMVKFEAMMPKFLACAKQVNPKEEAAWSACNTSVFGSDPKTAADAKALYCVDDKTKHKALKECFANAGIIEKVGDKENFKNCMAS